MGISGALIGISAGTLLMMYFVTGVGSYDLPTMARKLGANRAAAVRAGIWKDGPPAPEGAMPAADFILLAKGIKSLPVFPKVEGMSPSQVSRERALLESRTAQARLVAQTKDVAWTSSYVRFPQLATLKYGG